MASEDGVVIFVSFECHGVKEGDFVVNEDGVMLVVVSEDTVVVVNADDVMMMAVVNEDVVVGKKKCGVVNVDELMMMVVNEDDVIVVVVNEEGKKKCGVVVMCVWMDLSGSWVVSEDAVNGEGVMCDCVVICMLCVMDWGCKVGIMVD